MGAVRLRANIQSQAGLDWQIDIWDRDYASTVLEIDDDGFTIKWSSEGDDILEPLKTSTAVLQAYNRDTYSTAFDSFITDYIAGDEDQFKMLVYKGGVLNWVGAVIIDNATQENISNPQIFTINAVDGIGRLKNILFAEALTNPPSPKTLVQHIIDALEYNELSQFWGAGETYIQESFEFTETQVGALAATDSMLIRTTCTTSMFLSSTKNIDVDDTTRTRTWANDSTSNGVTLFDVTDTDVPLTAYQVIESIMRILSCRIMMSDGVYRIQQVRNFDNTTYAARNIVKAGTVASAATITPRVGTGKVQDSLTLTVMGGGTFQYMPGLLSSQVSTPNTWAANLLKVPTKQLFTSVNPITFTVDLGTMVGGTNRGLSVSWSDSFVALGLAIYDVDIEIEMKFIFGANRLLSNPTTPNTATWTTNASDVVSRVVRAARGALSLQEQSFFLTPDIPAGTHLGCTIEVTLTMVSRSGIALPADPDFEYDFNNFQIGLRDGSKFSSATTYITDNPSSTKYSVVLDFGTMRITDEGILSSYNSFYVDTTGGGVDVPSEEWDADYTTDSTLAKIVAKEAMSFQRSPVLLLQGPLEGPFIAHYVSQYDNQIFVLNGATYDVANDETTGEWFKLITARGSIVTDNERNVEPRGYNGKLPGFVSGSKKPKEWYDDFKDFNTDKAVSSAARTGGGAATSLSIFAPGNDLMKSGDKISIFDPLNGNEIIEVTLTADVGASDTSISFNSIIISDDIPVGATMQYDPNKYVVSEVGRFDELLTDELQINGAYSRKVTNVSTATHTVTDADSYIRVTYSGTVTITMAAASTMWDSASSQGKVITIKDSRADSEANPIIINRAGSDTFIYKATALESLTMQVDGLDLTFQCTTAATFDVY